MFDADTLDALDLLPDPVLIVSEAGRIVAANRAARELFALRTREGSAIALPAALHATDPGELALRLHDWVHRQEMGPATLELVDEFGQRKTHEIQVGPCRSPDGHRAVLIRFRREHLFERRFIELARRVNALGAALAAKRSSEQRSPRKQRTLEPSEYALRPAPTRDRLTQLPARDSFDTALPLMWSRCAEAQASLALVLLDLDRFIHYNTTYGHGAGDRCLQRVAQAIASRLRTGTDLAVRYGGEKFAVLLPETGSDDATDVAARILWTVRSLKIPHTGLRGRSFITVSAGVAACVPQPRLEPSALVAAAEAALLQAKTHGRDRTAVVAVPTPGAAGLRTFG